jgi:hypothetical protein
MPFDKKQPTVTPQALEIYKARISQIDFIKKQQWVVTNYAVAIYAAIVWVYNTLQHIPEASRWILIEITVAVGIAAIFLLWQFHCDLKKARRALDQANDYCFSDQQREALDLRAFPTPFTRGMNVLVPLMSVCFFGAVITLGFLISPHEVKDEKMIENFIGVAKPDNEMFRDTLWVLLMVALALLAGWIGLTSKRLERWLAKLDRGCDSNSRRLD